MKILSLILLFLTFSFTDICAEKISSNSNQQNIKEVSKIQFYAYSNVDRDRFNSQCILCTSSENYAATIAFTKHWKITLWKNQAYLGRALIIPKRHFGGYEEMNDEEAAEYREILRSFLPALKKTFGATHFNVAYLMNQAYRDEKPDPPQNEGQPNPHFHWHIIPRYNGLRNFNGQVFKDPDFGNCFDFNRKQYIARDFQKQAIEAIRENLDVVYLNSENSEKL